MIRSLLRTPGKFGISFVLGTTLVVVLLLLMGSIIVQLSFPSLGEAVANFVGHGYFARLIQVLY